MKLRFSESRRDRKECRSHRSLDKTGEEQRRRSGGTSAQPQPPSSHMPIVFYHISEDRGDARSCPGGSDEEEQQLHASTVNG